MDAADEEFIKSLSERAPDLKLDARTLQKLSRTRRDKLQVAVDLYLKMLEPDHTTGSRDKRQLTNSQCSLLQECARTSEEFYPGEPSSSSEGEGTSESSQQSETDDDESSPEERRTRKATGAGERRARLEGPEKINRMSKARKATKAQRLQIIQNHLGVLARPTQPSQQRGRDAQEPCLLAGTFLQVRECERQSL